MSITPDVNEMYIPSAEGEAVQRSIYNAYVTYEATCKWALWFVSSVSRLTSHPRHGLDI